MPNRVIKESIKSNEQIDSLTWFEEVLFYRLIVTADDYGCVDGRITLLKSELFPLKENVTKKAVSDAVEKLASVGLLCKYTVSGKPYLFFPTWEKHQRLRNKRRKYPAPTEENLSVICQSNDSQMTASCLPESESEYESNPNRTPYNPPKGDAFADFAGEDQVLFEALKAFEESRKKKRNPMTPRAKELLVDKLVKSPKEDWVQMLDNATLRGWSSVYPLKPEEKQQPTEVFRSGPVFSDERLERLKAREAANANT